jgi:hypothetical protein
MALRVSIFHLARNFNIGSILCGLAVNYKELFSCRSQAAGKAPGYEGKASENFWCKYCPGSAQNRSIVHKQQEVGQNKLKDLQALKSSLLDQAFRGKL